MAAEQVIEELKRLGKIADAQGEESVLLQGVIKEVDGKTQKLEAANVMAESKLQQVIIEGEAYARCVAFLILESPGHSRT